MKRTSALLIAALALVASAQPAAAPAAPGAASPVGIESPVISDRYVLMPGDHLLVTVSGGITFTYDATVSYEGRVTISIPNIGIVDAVPVNGLTVTAAEDTVTAAMLRYYKQVKVKLTLIGLRSVVVFLTGEVQNPGAYIASPVERVSQIIAHAGGLSPLGSRSHIGIVRNGQVAANVDLERFTADGDLSANPFVQSGDVISVPAVEALVTVKGAVFGRDEYRLRASTTTTEKERVSEGIYELEPGSRVSDMIQRAGGVTPWADMSNAYVDRLVAGGSGTRKRLPVDLRRIIYEQDTTRDLELMNADIVVVPPINTLVYVEGEVTEPKAYTFSPNQRFSDYLGQAGGPTNYANMRTAYIVRGGRKIGVHDNPIVEPGDIVMMPRVSLKWWQDYVSIISAIGIPIATIFITLALRN
jgi:protein involved in polysaccharide export with SLBB domain